MNNVVYLMTRKQYDIKGSRWVNCHMKFLCSVDKCQSISLLYPEGMLFPSLNLKYTNDKWSIVGAIPSSLLNLCWIQEGFIYIKQHIHTRLTSTSNAMGSDPRYICHCYYTMENLSASCNDTQLVINHSLTVSEYKHVNLGDRRSGYSSILGYIDSKHMVKNICTSQKYLSWSYFLNFYSKPKQTFWNKCYSKMIGICFVRTPIQNIINFYIVIKNKYMLHWIKVIPG